jgi:hypothetical protein
MKSDEIRNTLKHPKKINGNIKKNLRKRIKRKDKGNVNFYFKNLTLPLVANIKKTFALRGF